MKYELDIDLSNRSIKELINFCYYIVKEEAICNEESYVVLSNWMAGSIISAVVDVLETEHNVNNKEVVWNTKSLEIHYDYTIEFVEYMLLKIIINTQIF